MVYAKNNALRLLSVLMALILVLYVPLSVKAEGTEIAMTIKWNDGYSMDKTTGELTKADPVGYSVSDPIYVQEGLEYVLKSSDRYGYNLALVCYDASDTLLVYQDLFRAGAAGTYDASLTLPDGTEYFRLRMSLSILNVSEAQPLTSLYYVDNSPPVVPEDPEPGRYVMPLEWNYKYVVDKGTGELISNTMGAVTSDMYEILNADYKAGFQDSLYGVNIYVAYYNADRAYLLCETLFDYSGGEGLSYAYLDIPDNARYMIFTMINKNTTNSDWMAQELIPKFSVEYTMNEEEEDLQKNIFDLLLEWFGNFFVNLGETVKSWFVPDTGELTLFLQEVNAWFSDRLGFLWYPFDFAIDVIVALESGYVAGEMTIPAFNLVVNGTSYTIWNDFTFNLDPAGIFVYVRLFTGFLLISAVVRLAINKWDEWIGGHGTG